MQEAVIIGAGLAGLSCANALTAAGVPFTLLEAADAPGGRIRTDLVEGFLLDRGFQVLLTAYPEARRLLNYNQLALKKFTPGALVWHGGKFHRFADPLRDPLGGLQALIDPMLPTADKLRIARLRAQVQRGSWEAMFAQPEKTTLDYLRAVPFSARTIDSFFRPFFGGVFLEDQLVTSSRFFEFLFRMFAGGDTVVPARGMQQIPRQMHARLPDGTVRTNARVAGIERCGDEHFRVQLQSGETVDTRRVVLAVGGDQGNALMSGVGGWRLPEVREWNRTTAFYYGATRAPVAEPILLLNGEGRAAGPINHAAVMSSVSAHYAPAGASLIVANVIGEAPREPVVLSQLEAAVRLHLTKWFGSAVTSWKMLAAYPVAKALPLQRHAEWEKAGVRVEGSGGVYLCGDYRETASTQGALASGRRAAEAFLQDRATGRAAGAGGR